MLFYLLFFLDILKRLFLFTNLFLVLPNILIKLLALFLLALSLYLIRYIPDFNKIKFRFKKLSELRSFRHNFLENVIHSYRISKSFPVQSCIYILGVFLYISIYILGILYIKIHNTKMEIDLRKTLETSLGKILCFSLIDQLIFLLAAILTYLIFILAFYKIKNLFNKPIFAVHYYLCKTEWYFDLYSDKTLNLTADAIIYESQKAFRRFTSYLVFGKIPIYNRKDDKYENLSDVELNIHMENKTLNLFRRLTNNFIRVFFEQLPLVLIALCTAYDLIFNNLTLHYVFLCYPFAYMVQIWLNISRFIAQRSFMLDFDMKDLIYYSQTPSNNIQDLVSYMLNEFQSYAYLELKEWRRRTKKYRKNKRKVKVRRILRKIKKLLVNQPK